MADEYFRVFAAEKCVFPRLTPALLQQIALMEDWPLAQRTKFTRRLLAPRHWTCVPDRIRVEHNSNYLCYRQALGPDCPRRFPVLAKDLSANDSAKMPFAESLQKIHFRNLPGEKPLDGDRAGSLRLPF